MGTALAGAANMTEATDYREGDFADEPSAEVPTRVHIVAPSAMPEGYIFEAEVGAAGSKRTISAEVPPGGVTEGQIFTVPLPDDFAVGEARVDIPTGRWKDRWFDIFNEGICHSSVWCSVCFTQGEYLMLHVLSPPITTQ